MLHPENISVDKMQNSEKSDSETHEHDVERRDPKTREDCCNMGICWACYFGDEKQTKYVNSMKALTTDGCCTKSEYDRYTKGVPFPDSIHSILARRGHDLDQLKETYGKTSVDDLERESQLQSRHYLIEEMEEILKKEKEVQNRSKTAQIEKKEEDEKIISEKMAA